jgi:hypothetical protein
MLNKFFAFILFVVGIVFVVAGVLVYQDGWSIIWRIILGIFLIIGAVVLANLETTVKKVDDNW